jgi:hypothetical protein
METLNHEVRSLRRQQRTILEQLDEERPAVVPFLTGDRFVELLELAGVTQRQRHALHQAFERESAAEHQAFLEFLCFPDDAIERIRAI